MTNNLPETEKYVEELLQEFPGLQRFSNRMKMIAELVKDAEQETSPEYMADSFKTILRLQERLHAEMTGYVSNEFSKNFEGMADNCRKWKAIAEKLETALKEKQQAYNDLHDKICFCMMVNPRYTFENVILKAVERKEKIADASGQSWQWGLHFPLIARLRMAFKLVFGRKDIQKCIPGETILKGGE